MEIDIKIVSADYELVFDLVGSRRFPERRPIICPGDAILSSQSLKAAGEEDYSDDIIELSVTINENTSIEEFAKWLFHTLVERDEAIISFAINGAELPLDEKMIREAIKSGVGK